MKAMKTEYLSTRAVLAAIAAGQCPNGAGVASRPETPAAAELEARLRRSTKRGGDGCWEWQGARTTAGYGHFYLRGTHYYAHRLALELANGPIPDGQFACHRCDNPRCVNPDHLFAGTCRDNVVDMKAKGRHVARTGDASGSRTKPESRPRGSRCVNAKLTESQVLAMRAERADGVQLKALAAKYGVSYRTVCGIVYREKWRHI